MILYLTRHGQVDPENYFKSVDFPIGDMPLTPLGKQQAHLLGERISKLKFKGKLYSSPYRRTLETAAGIAASTLCKITPCAVLREVINTDEEAASFSGMTIDAIKSEFQIIDENAKLKYPWWSDKKDEIHLVCERIKPFLEKIIQKDQDVFIVGHGATVYGVLHNLIRIFNLDILPKGMVLSDFLAQRNLNCNLSRFEITDGKLTSAELFDTMHISEDNLTSNRNKKERPEKIIIRYKEKEGAFCYWHGL